MALIRKIINFFKWLFKILFSKRKVTEKVKKKVKYINNKRYLKKYDMLTGYVDDSLPVYLKINVKDKDLLLEKVKLIKTKLLENNIIIEEKLNNEINEISKKLEKMEISFYENEKLEEKINTFLMDKDLNSNTSKKIDTLYKDVMEIVNNYDKSIKDKVVNKYGKVNYITISTIVIDETLEEIKHLEYDYKHHKYNKFYYERELNKIKKRISELGKLHDTNKIYEEIFNLKKDIYIKSKDKYDILYNNEIFININNLCDEFINKVNKRVIDIKKENKEEKEVIKKENKEEKKKELNDWKENILKRFKDIELARKILLINKNDDIEINNIDTLITDVSRIYYEFISGEKAMFNFERNKIKTELVKFYNNVNYINSLLTKKEYIFIDHINYKMNDLIEFSMSKKEELESNLKLKFNIKKEDNEMSVLADNKLELLKEKENEKNNTNSKVKIKIDKNNL